MQRQPHPSATDGPLTNYISPLSQLNLPKPTTTPPSHHPFGTLGLKSAPAPVTSYAHLSNSSSAPHSTANKRPMSRTARLSAALARPFSCAILDEDDHNSLSNTSIGDLFGPFAPERYMSLPHRSRPAIKALFAVAMTKGQTEAANLEAARRSQDAQSEDTPTKRNDDHVNKKVDPWFDDCAAILLGEKLSIQPQIDAIAAGLHVSNVKLPSPWAHLPPNTFAPNRVFGDDVAHFCDFSSLAPAVSKSSNLAPPLKQTSRPRTTLDVFVVHDDKTGAVSIDWNEVPPRQKSTSASPHPFTSLHRPKTPAVASDPFPTASSSDSTKKQQLGMTTHPTLQIECQVSANAPKTALELLLMERGVKSEDKVNHAANRKSSAAAKLANGKQGEPVDIIVLDEDDNDAVVSPPPMKMSRGMKAVMTRRTRQLAKAEWKKKRDAGRKSIAAALEMSMSTTKQIPKGLPSPKALAPSKAVPSPKVEVTPSMKTSPCLKGSQNAKVASLNNGRLSRTKKIDGGEETNDVVEGQGDAVDEGGGGNHAGGRGGGRRRTSSGSGGERAGTKRPLTSVDMGKSSVRQSQRAGGGVVSRRSSRRTRASLDVKRLVESSDSDDHYRREPDDDFELDNDANDAAIVPVASKKNSMKNVTVTILDDDEPLFPETQSPPVLAASAAATAAVLDKLSKARVGEVRGVNERGQNRKKEVKVGVKDSDVAFDQMELNLAGVEETVNGRTSKPDGSDRTLAGRKNSRRSQRKGETDMGEKGDVGTVEEGRISGSDMGSGGNVEEVEDDLVGRVKTLWNMANKNGDLEQRMGMDGVLWRKDTMEVEAMINREEGDMVDICGSEENFFESGETLPIVRGMSRSVVEDEANVEDVLSDFDVTKETLRFYKDTRDEEDYTPNNVESFGTRFSEELFEDPQKGWNMRKFSSGRERTVGTGPVQGPGPVQGTRTAGVARTAGTADMNLEVNTVKASTGGGVDRGGGVEVGGSGFGEVVDVVVDGFSGGGHGRPRTRPRSQRLVAKQKAKAQAQAQTQAGTKAGLGRGMSQGVVLLDEEGDSFGGDALAGGDGIVLSGGSSDEERSSGASSDEGSDWEMEAPEVKGGSKRAREHMRKRVLKGRELQKRVCGDMIKTMCAESRKCVLKWAMHDYSCFNEGNGFMEVEVEVERTECSKCDEGNIAGFCEAITLLRLWKDMSWRKVRRMKHRTAQM